MKLSAINKNLTKNIPKSETWNRAKNEAYGLFNKPSKDINIKKALYCVTNSHDVINYAKNNDYDMIIEHHPFNFKSSVPTFIFHTALDCCDGGLNNIWADYLGIGNKHFDDNLGAFGNLKESDTFDNILAKIEKFIGTDVIGQIKNTTKNINSITVCAGLGGIVLKEATNTNTDLYITGELTGDVEYSKFKNIIEIGHTLSERCGIETFKKLLPNIQIDLVPLYLDKFGDETCYPDDIDRKLYEDISDETLDRFLSKFDDE